VAAVIGIGLVLAGWNFEAAALVGITWGFGAGISALWGLLRGVGRLIRRRADRVDEEHPEP
jgi:hypothetical protein